MTLGRLFGGFQPRGAVFALALVALALRVLIPSGFMVSDQPTNQGYPIVICTGHGALTLDVGAGHKSPAPKSKADAPCGFAGAASPIAPTLAILAPIAHSLSQPVLASLPLDQAPGRGLAAPPPPSIGPPRLI